MSGWLPRMMFRFTTLPDGGLAPGMPMSATTTPPAKSTAPDGVLSRM